jgi:hypothetical protein
VANGLGSAIGNLKIMKWKRFFNTSTQFTNARIIHCGFDKCKTLDDDQKKVIPQLAIDTEVFHRVFANPVKPKAHSEQSYCSIGNWMPNCQLLYEMAL